ncbi:MAG: DUF4255 domain-containing protein [Scytonematopsis contorta HA4267-MV1]|jgi:hypothetical protein|nr:DUF4255 domain-containing protein [Scytonematopsis contorta HA4267-MV1]
MSNYLAIATVTATLKRILQIAIQQDVPGATVTTVRPDANGSNIPEVGINIFMYQATPNPAWRNADLRTRRPKGELSKQSQAGIDLYYLFTFHGNEVEYEPQRLLGSTIRTLVDQPVLTQEMIAETVNNCEFILGSTLAEQLEKVTLTPVQMNTEELSKIWSVFFQSPYVLSFAYQGSTILIEGDKPGKAGLPVKNRRFTVTIPNQPIIEEITSEEGLNRLFMLTNTIIIRGKNLQGNNAKVKIGEAIITPQNLAQSANDTQIRFHLDSLSPQEKQRLRIGVQSIQVQHYSSSNHDGFQPTAISNSLPFILIPTIQDGSIVKSEVEIDNNLYTLNLALQVNINVGVEQKIFLLLNQLASTDPSAYVFGVQSRNEITHNLTFKLKDIKPGEYLMRVQIDGADSLLESASLDSDEYTGPILEI